MTIMTAQKYHVHYITMLTTALNGLQEKALRHLVKCPKAFG